MITEEEIEKVRKLLELDQTIIHEGWAEKVWNNMDEDTKRELVEVFKGTYGL